MCPIDGDAFETLRYPAGKADPSADPECAVRRFRERLDAGTGQAVGHPKLLEAFAVVAEQAILRSHPYEADMILDETLYAQIGEALLFTVELEGIALRQTGEHRQRGHEEVFNSAHRSYT